MSIRIKEQNAQ